MSPLKDKTALPPRNVEKLQKANNSSKFSLVQKTVFILTQRVILIIILVLACCDLAVVIFSHPLILFEVIRNLVLTSSAENIPIIYLSRLLALSLILP